MLKDKYEISLWDDVLVAAAGDVPAHYEEKKIAIIGSDTMTASCRAHEPKLVENINGTHTLTFKMYYVCEEDVVEDTIYKYQLGVTTSSAADPLNKIFQATDFTARVVPNPYLNLLVNERKVKCKWKDKWFDLVIKNCQEDSSGKSITYTCIDVFINELSKTGYDLELSTELENNQGTASELGERVLEGTDWTLINTDSTDPIQELKEEPVYEAELENTVTVTNETDGGMATITSGLTILVFYNQLQDIIQSSDTTGTAYIQFAFADSYSTDTNSQLVNNAKCYSWSSVTWQKTTVDEVNCIALKSGSTVYAYVYYLAGVSTNYRASRLVRSQKCILDPLTGKYCYVYKATSGGTGDFSDSIEADDIIYQYDETVPNDPTVVNNLLVNSKDFISTEGWSGNGLVFQLYPAYTAATDISTYNGRAFLGILSSQNVYNAGLRQSSSYIPNGLSRGEQYVFRYKAMGNSSGAPSGTYLHTNVIKPTVATYKFDSNGKVVIDQGSGTYTYFDVGDPVTNDDWTEYTLTCKKSVSRSNIYRDKVGFFLVISGAVWLEEVEFFPLKYGTRNGSSVRIDPGEMDIQSVITVEHVYYNHTKSQGLLSAEYIDELWRSTSYLNLDYVVAQYNEDFVKVRSIDAKQSNRFNMLQSIAETFECWAEFTINHDSTGRIIYNSNGTPQKYVRFKKEIGTETGLSFVYGIDLKTIQRTIQSDQIVTKTIVNPNNNEFATDGMCTIARSTENYPRVNFILNFDYYINQGLINGGELNKDLYLSTDSIGYYYYLHQWNTEYDNLTELLIKKKAELTNQNSYKTVYEATISSISQQIEDIKNELMDLANVSTWSSATAFIKANSNKDAVKSRMASLKSLETMVCNDPNDPRYASSYIAMLTRIEASIATLASSIEDMEDRQDELTSLMRAKHYEFYKKYSRFIQEGSWISENYIDDNLYFLDAQSVAYTSSRPQISYNISVLRLSALEEFKDKIFELGDIASVQDTEFFGYIYVGQVKTPYREKVLVSEVTSWFDEPEKDTFKVQNYKTQFEDLFQRITSTTQTLQYASGEYARAAAAIESTGVINSETLQASIAKNEELVYSAKNEAVYQDSTGITVADLTDANKKTKITSGGLFITTDGGQTWKNAVRGEGISTQYLTTGEINTSVINVMDGNFKTFRWDETGINAYDIIANDGGVNLAKFVRFDHYGIYGVDGQSEFTPSSEADIWDNAKFGMTWRGFFLKNKYGAGLVEITSEDDIRVLASPTNERIKIGRLGGSGTTADPYTYGIRISDASNSAVMETADDGTLWLRKALYVSKSSSAYDVQIGYLDAVKEGTSIHEVINATDKFIVYEDGSMKATTGEFTGTIHATGGTIGNVTINEFQDSAYKVVIESSDGTMFKNGTGSKTLTAKLFKGNDQVTTGLTYTWYKDSTVISGATSSSITVAASDVTGTSTYECVIGYSS